MKRKMTALLTVVLMLAMLAGCGNSSTTDTATDGSTSDSASGTSKETASSNGGTLSECLSTEKVIAYEVDTVDKSETPDNVYFFENGKVTIIPGKEFGLTMGDFAQMTDEEIWSTYETVRETYADNYKTEKFSNINFAKEYEDIEAELEYLNRFQEIVSENKTLDVWYNEGLRRICKAVENGSEDNLWLSKAGISADAIDKTYTLTEDFTAEEVAAINSYLENSIAKCNKYNEIFKNLEETGSSAYKAPFFDMPFSFVVMTDSSGNNVMNEVFVYPTSMYDITDVPDEYYDSLTFANVEGAERQIYDTTYNCFGLGSGDAIFCTRASMTLDTIDSKNVLVDLSKDEINELFKEEVMARYE